METDTSKVAEVQATETPIVTTESPVKPKRDSKKMLLTASAIALPILLVLGGLSLVAANRGKGNALSKIANYLPIEQIPGLKNLGKSDSETLRDAFSKELSAASLTKTLGGREQKVSMELNAVGKDTDGADVDVNVKVNTTTAISKDADKAKYNLTVGGKIKSGIVNIDLGTEGLKADILMPNKNAVYMSMDLSKQVLDTFGPQIDSQLASSGMKLSDVLGKYAKLDIAALTKDLEASMGTTAALPSNLNQEKVTKATEELMNAISKDATALYEKTFGDFERYTTLSNEGKKTINGQKANVIKVSLKEDKVGDVAVEFTEGFIKVLKDHRSDLEKFCVNAELEKTAGQKCSEIFAEKMFNEIKFDDTAKKQVKDGLTQMFAYIKFDDVRFYVNVDDSTLVKTEMTIRATEKALKDISSTSNSPISKLEFMLGTEELSRGKEVSITEPKEYADLNKLIKENLMDKQNQLNNLLQNNSFTPPSTMTPGTPSRTIQCTVISENGVAGYTVLDASGSCVVTGMDGKISNGAPCVKDADASPMVDGTYDLALKMCK